MPTTRHALTLLFTLLTFLVTHGSTTFAAEPAEVDAAEVKNFAGRVRLALPRQLYAVVGVESNVYFDNVLLTTDLNNYALDVVCNRGSQQSERWTYTPQAGEEGQYTFALEVRDEQNVLIARGESRLHVAPADAAGGRKASMLMIGDSLTHASIYPEHVLNRCQGEGNPELTLIGSHGPGGKPGRVRHEGYGGWTAKRFATLYTGVARTGNYRERGSPFIYKEGEEEPKLDFASYCREMNNGQPPEVATLFLGPNDVFSATDANIEERVDGILQHFETLAAMIHEHNSETKIGILLPNPPAATQDAFGANYKSSQTRWQYRRNQHRLLERMMEQFGGREEKSLYLVPTHVNLDCLHNYPASKVKWNAHNDQETLRLSNGVHPAASGYRQIGDEVYCWLKSALSN